MPKTMAAEAAAQHRAFLQNRYKPALRDFHRLLFQAAFTFSLRTARIEPATTVVNFTSGLTRFAGHIYEFSDNSILAIPDQESRGAFVISNRQDKNAAKKILKGAEPPSQTPSGSSTK